MRGTGRGTSRGQSPAGSRRLASASARQGVAGQPALGVVLERQQGVLPRRSDRGRGGPCARPVAPRHDRRPVAPGPPAATQKARGIAPGAKHDSASAFRRRASRASSATAGGVASAPAACRARARPRASASRRRGRGVRPARPAGRSRTQRRPEPVRGVEDAEPRQGLAADGDPLVRRAGSAAGSSRRTLATSCPSASWRRACAASTGPNRRCRCGVTGDDPGDQDGGEEPEGRRRAEPGVPPAPTCAPARGARARARASAGRSSSWRWRSSWSSRADW